MIYLIDDNLRNQQREYNAGYLGAGTYDSLIKSLYILMETSDFSPFETASCLFLHDSFPDFNANNEVVHGSAKILDRIVNIASAKKIPIVRFSNSYIGLEQSEFDKNGLTGINKWLFYQNLEPFILNYKDKAKIELKILAYGPHYIYKEMQLLYHKIANDLQTNYMDSSRDEILPKLKEFGELCSSWESIQERFNRCTGPELLLYLDKIIKSVIRYGRNIHN